MKKSTSGENLKKSGEAPLRKSGSREKLTTGNSAAPTIAPGSLATVGGGGGGSVNAGQNGTSRRIRRTKSLGELDEHSRLSKLVKVFQTRFGRLKRNAENTMGTYPSLLSFQVVAVALIPFLPVYFYALVVFFSSFFLFGYLIFLILYFLILLAWAVTEIAIRPPWYQPSTLEEGLPTKDTPAYWQGVIHNPKHDLGLKYKDIEFKNSSGLTIRGWYVAAPNSQTAVVLVHGGGTDRRAWLRHVPLFHSENINCLLFDCSEHGLSDGSHRGFSFGVREHNDVRAAVRFLKEVYQMKIVIACGTSVGGASVILAGALDPLIDGVIAENPVARVDEFAVYHLDRLLSPYTSPWFHHLFLKPFYGLVMRLFLFRIGENPWNAVYTPEELVHRISPRPLLLMHGDDDNIVPCDHSYRLFESAKEPKVLWIAREANHCALYDKYPDQYYKYIHEYLATHFVGQKSITASSPALQSILSKNGNDGPELNTSTGADSTTPKGRRKKSQ